MEQKLTIKGVEKKTSQSGKTFYSVSTDKGKMSCWDKDLSERLSANKDKICLIETETKDNFTNIKKFIKAISETNKFPESMKVSYKKDIFNKLVDKSIENTDMIELAKLAVKIYEILSNNDEKSNETEIEEIKPEEWD
jgi:L-ribulose-5-phosphate 3-epimerase UlaE